MELGLGKLELTITTTHSPATDLGYLLHKHPDKVQSFNIPGGKAVVFYLEATEQRCTATLLMDINNIDLVKVMRIPVDYSLMKHYVNDRPYVASSFMSSAISKVYGTAMNGNCKAKPELTAIEMPLQCKLSPINVKGGEEFIRRMFEPLGYDLNIHRLPIDSLDPEWGNSDYYSIALKNNILLKHLLSQLYILIPVFDKQRHYWISKQNVDVLLEKGSDWLPTHPEVEVITKYYLKHLRTLTQMALDRLLADKNQDSNDEQTPNPIISNITGSLNRQRYKTVMETLKELGGRRVLDLGCGDGRLIKLLLKDSQFFKIIGMDVSYRSLQRAKASLYMDEMSPKMKARIDFIHGSLLYRDERLKGFDIAVILEVVEHIDPDRLIDFEKVIFKLARPANVILTTPNSEYNRIYSINNPSEYRHPDHRFEWSRDQFSSWVERIGSEYDYSATLQSIGDVNSEYGSPTQMAVFKRKSWGDD